MGGGGGERVVTDSTVIAPHNVDWLHNLRGQSQLLLCPRTTHEVSRILAHCNKRRLPLIKYPDMTVCEVSNNDMMIIADWQWSPREEILD